MLKHLVFGSVLFAFGVAMIYGVIHIIGGREIAEVFFNFTPWGIIPILILTILSAAIAIWRWQLILETQGYKFGFRALIPIWFAGYAFSYITPIVYMGGEGIRAWFLKERYGVPWHIGSASIFLDKAINSMIVVVLIVLSIGAFIFFAGLPELTKTILGALSGFVLFIIAMGFVLFRSFRNQSAFFPFLRIFSVEKTSLGKFLAKFEKELQDFLSLRSRAMWEALAWTAIKHVLTWGRNLLIIYFLGLGWQVGGSTVALGATYLTYALPMPGALGVQEILQSLLFSQFGWGAQTGAVFSLIYRGAELFLVVFGAIVLIRSATALIVWRLRGASKNNNNHNTALHKMQGTKHSL